MTDVKNRKFVSGKKCRVFLTTSNPTVGLKATIANGLVTNVEAVGVADSGQHIYTMDGVNGMTLLTGAINPLNQVGDLIGIEFDGNYEDEELEIIDGTWDTHIKPNRKVCSVTLNIVRSSNLFEKLYEKFPMGVVAVGEGQKSHYIRHPNFGYRIIIDDGSGTYDVYDHLEIKDVKTDTSEKYATELSSISFEGNYFKFAQSEANTVTIIPLTGGL